MERAFVDVSANQAICCWNAPDRQRIEALFARANVKPESVREVMEYSG